MMSTSLPYFVLLLAASSLVGTDAQAQAQPQPPQATARSAADRELKALYDGYAAWNAKQSGYLLDEKGETKPLDYLPRVDAQTQQRQADYLKNLLDKLNSIPTA